VVNLFIFILKKEKNSRKLSKKKIVPFHFQKRNLQVAKIPRKPQKKEWWQGLCLVVEKRKTPLWKPC
jgi:hypothetical protein